MHSSNKNTLNFKQKLNTVKSIDKIGNNNSNKHKVSYWKIRTKTIKILIINLLPKIEKKTSHKKKVQGRVIVQLSLTNKTFKNIFQLL